MTNRVKLKRLPQVITHLRLDADEATVQAGFKDLRRRFTRLEAGLPPR